MRRSSTGSGVKASRQRPVYTERTSKFNSSEKSQRVNSAHDEVDPGLRTLRMNPGVVILSSCVASFDGAICRSRYISRKFSIVFPTKEDLQWPIRIVLELLDVALEFRDRASCTERARL